MEEVADEPLYRDRVCGIDIGKAQMAATIRVPPGNKRSPPDAGDQDVRRYEAGGVGTGGLAAVLAGTLLGTATT